MEIMWKIVCMNELACSALSSCSLPSAKTPHLRQNLLIRGRNNDTFGTAVA